MYQQYLTYYHQIGLSNQLKFVMLSGHFHASKHKIFRFQPTTNLNCVFISYTPQRLCYYNANYNKNIVLFVICLQELLPQRLLNRKSLEFSCAVTISHLHKRAEARSLHINTEVFNIAHRKRQISCIFRVYLVKNISK